MALSLHARKRWLFCAAAVFVAAATAFAANPQQVQYLIKSRQCPKCDLKNAELVGIDLSGANLQESDVSGAVFYRTNLRGANFTGATFQGTNFVGAWLKGAVGVTFQGAKTDQSTECPDGKAGPCN